jgi:hypothetical protein
MDFSQTLRNAQRTARAKVARLRAGYAAVLAGRANAARAAAAREAARAASRRRRRPFFILAFTAFAAIVLFYPLAAWWNSRLDDNLNFTPDAAFGENSRAVAAIAALLDREVNRNGWTPNDPFFMPSALLTGKPNFQRGIVFALAAAAAAFPGDVDMREAATLLRYPPDDWMGNPAISFWSGNSEAQYRKAIAALMRANAKPADAAHGAERLAALIAALRADLNVEALAIDARMHAPAHFVLSASGERQFYVAKGRLYADAIVLKAAQADFTAIIAQRQLNGDWTGMIENLEQGAGLRPVLVMNGAPDSLFFPCHLCAEGFFLARADAAMGRLSEKLR